MEKSQLIKCCDELMGLDEQARKWLGENHPDEDGRQKNLRRVHRALKICKTSLERNMSIGVFGPSQAGKSYLLSALARDANGVLCAKFADENVNFIEEINPPGGKESTGLVTRFTLNEPKGISKEFPVHLELLSETDLVKIFANSFYQDVKASDVPLEKVNESLAELKSRMSKEPNGQISSDDSEDLQEYIKEYRSNLVVGKLQETTFLEDLVNLSPFLSREDRLDLYSNLWNRNEKITAELRQLLLNLEYLDYATEVNAVLSSLRPREKSIIDVATLGIASRSEIQLEKIPVRTPAGSVVELPRSILAALTAELTIVMPRQDKDDPFYRQNDLLDFPGYRARKELQAATLNDADARSMFLRGKVDYLFQRYRDRFELNSLLLCVGPSNQEAAGLPAAISRWVEKTHGKTPEERSFDYISLFFVLTKADTQFQEVAGNKGTEGRWDIRFHASVIEYFRNNSQWLENWSGGRPFNNFFLLRNPNFKWDSIMDYDASGHEKCVREEKAEYVNKLQEDFMKSKFTQRHFVDKAEAWNALMSLNDGGISYIKKKIVPDPDLKEKQLALVISENKRVLLQQIECFYRSDDKQKEFEKKATQVLTLANKILANSRLYNRFPSLISGFTVQQNELFRLSAKSVEKYEMEKHKLSAEMENHSQQECESLGDLESTLFGMIDSIEAGKQENQNIDTLEKDEDYYYAAAVVEQWQRLMESAVSDNLQQRYYNLDRRELDLLVEEIGNAIRRFSIVDYLAKQFKEIRSKATNAQPDQKTRKQASFASDYINKFISWLPTDKQADASKLYDRKVMVVSREVSIFPHPDEVPFGQLPKLPEKPLAMSARMWTSSWMFAFFEMVRCNVYEGKDPNPEQNQALGFIIEKINKTIPNAKAII